jgi:hypothetical protein
MKKNKFCFECDTDFTVSAKGQDHVSFCPFCAAPLDEDEETFEDDDD